MKDRENFELHSLWKRLIQHYIAVPFLSPRRRHLDTAGAESAARKSATPPITSTSTWRRTRENDASNAPSKTARGSVGRKRTLSVTSNRYTDSREKGPGATLSTGPKRWRSSTPRLCGSCSGGRNRHAETPCRLNRRRRQRWALILLCWYVHPWYILLLHTYNGVVASKAENVCSIDFCIRLKFLH